MSVSVFKSVFLSDNPCRTCEYSSDNFNTAYSHGLQYINAETTAGGIAHWATSEVAGTLRTNDTDWKAAWQAYVQGIIDVTAPNQISNGGPVIGE